MNFWERFAINLAAVIGVIVLVMVGAGIFAMIANATSPGWTMIGLLGFFIVALCALDAHT